MKHFKIWCLFILYLFSYQISYSQDITSDTTLAGEYYKLADLFTDKTNMDSAIYYATKSLELYVKYLGENCLENSNNLYLLGINYYNLKKYDLSLEKYFKCLEIKKLYIDSNDVSYSLIYTNIGIDYRKIKSYENSLFYYNKAIEIYNNLFLQNSIEIARIYYLKGIVYALQEKYVECLDSYFKALDLQIKISGEFSFYCYNTYTNIGTTYLTLSEYDKALNYFNKVLNISIILYGENNNELGDIYNNIGLVYYYKFEYDKAIEYHLKSLNIKKHFLSENDDLIATSYNNIGIAYRKKNEFDKAQEYYEKALKININNYTINSSQVASTYNNLAIIFNNKKDYDKSLEYHKKSLNLRLKFLGEYSEKVAQSYINISSVYENKLEFDSSLFYSNCALKIVKYLFNNKNTLETQIYVNNGVILKKMGLYNESLFNYQKGIENCLLNNTDTINYNTLPEINNFLEWNYLLQAINGKAEVYTDLSINLDNIKKEEQLEYALNHFEKCDTIISIIRNEITNINDKITLGEISNNIYKNAIKISFNLLLIRTELKDYYMEKTFDFSEKAKNRILLDEIAQKNALIKANIPDNLIEKEKNLVTEISFYQNAIYEEEDSLLNLENKNKLFDLKREHENLISEFKNNYPKYANLKYDSKVPKIIDIQNIIDSETALRSYSICDSMIYIFTISQFNFRIDTISKNKNFENEIINFKNSLEDTDKKDNISLLQNSQIVYNQLFPSYADFDSNIKNIVIIPDDSLSLIPFEALVCENFNGDINNYSEFSFLIKKYNISYSPSVSLYYNLNILETKAPKYDIAIFAPVFSGKDTLIDLKSESMFENEISYRSYLEVNAITNKRYIKPLLYTENEGNSIFKTFGKRNAQLLMFNSATEEFAKSDKISDFKIIHFATHAVSNTDESNLCGIILAQDTINGEDGFLHANEIYNLNLNTELVTLSACETAVGKIVNGEGIMDLSRAFFYAGSKNVIASLWKVEDKSTSELMINFYKNYNDKNLSISKSLQNAKLDMLKSSNEKYRHPKYWATFLLIGN